MKNILFPSDFYIKVRAPNFEDICSEVERGYQTLERDDAHWSEHCKVQTVHFEEDEFVRFLEPSFELFKEQYGYNGKIQCVDAWCNFYERGYFQEIHTHPDCDFAAAMILNSGPDFARFYFANRMMGLTPTKYVVDTTFVPDMEPGDILFFPSYVLHGVSPHKSDIMRASLSFNIKLTSL